MSLPDEDVQGLVAEKRLGQARQRQEQDAPENNHVENKLSRQPAWVHR